MATVILGPHERFDAALKRFSKKVQLEGIMAEVRRREYFEKPGDAKRRKHAAAVRRERRKAAKQSAPPQAWIKGQRLIPTISYGQKLDLTPKQIA
jgi:small subunit ribosomal protein S21